jgi:carbon-monoxide dehydrogenase medium subunit
VRVPRSPGDDWGFQKFRRRSIDWAIVGVCYQGGSAPGIGLVNMGQTTVRAAKAEAALAAGRPRREVADLADAAADPPSDAAGTAQYRRALSRVLVARALERERSA